MNGNAYMQQNGNGYANQLGGGSNGYTNQLGISNGYINPDVIPIQSQQHQLTHQLTHRPPSREEALDKGGFLGKWTVS